MPTATGYVAPAEKVKVVITPGVTIPEKVGSRYTHGDEVDPFEVANATLRDIAKERTASKRISANARKAKAELARRAGNRAAKKAN